MTATERLRALLDERGVEWHGTGSVYGGDFDAIESVWKDGALDVTLYGVSPEQAVAATLGRGTCRMELPDLRGPAYTDVYVCSECGGEVMVGTVMGVSDAPKWCPWCGREVIE